MQPGETVGRFKVLKHLAAGGMADLYLAKLSGPVGFEKLFVIKSVLRSLAGRGEVIRMFLDEARLAARLSHPNIGQIYELGEAQDGYFLAMEYVCGENLAAVRRAANRLRQGVPPFFVTRVAGQILEALGYAHGFKDPQHGIDGIVHRDVTPHNILISFDGHVKLVDFGIAKAVGRVQTEVGRLKGKFAYLAPEALRQDPLDGRADLYSLGVAMYELIAGEHPFEADSAQGTLRRIVEGDYRPLDQAAPGCPAGIVATVHRALAPRLEDRYASAQQMAEALQAAIDAERLATTAAGMAEYMRVLFGERLKQAQTQVEEGIEPTVEVALASISIPGLAEDSPSPAAATRDLTPQAAREPPMVSAIPIRTAPITESLLDIPAPPGAVFAIGKRDRPSLRRLSLTPRRRIAAAFVAGAAASALVMGIAMTLAGDPLPMDVSIEASEPRVGAHRERGAEADAAASAHGLIKVSPSGAPVTGTLVVRADVFATVYIDGRRVGTGPWRGQVAPGDHTVEIRVGAAKRRARVSVPADQVRTVTLSVRRR